MGLSRRAATGVMLGLALPASLTAAPVAVRHVQGAAHAFVEVTDLDGVRVAFGDVVERVRGDTVTSRVTLHFLDGSLDDETTRFTQRGTFHLLSDHHVQQGPSFPKPMDVTVRTSDGTVTFHDDRGQRKSVHLSMPADVSNGLPVKLLMNLNPSGPYPTMAFVVASDKPRLIHLNVKKAGNVTFEIGNLVRQATDYAVHVDFGGVAGLVAPLIGREPPDYHIWITPGEDPAFIREIGPLYDGGPIRRIQQISPAFPR